MALRVSPASWGGYWLVGRRRFPRSSNDPRGLLTETNKGCSDYRMRSYADGIIVLYGTNTFKCRVWSCKSTFHALCPPCCLEMITSLELLWILNAAS